MVNYKISHSGIVHQSTSCYCGLWGKIFFICAQCMFVFYAIIIIISSSECLSYCVCLCLMQQTQIWMHWPWLLWFWSGRASFRHIHSIIFIITTGRLIWPNPSVERNLNWSNQAEPVDWLLLLPLLLLLLVIVLVLLLLIIWLH